MVIEILPIELATQFGVVCDYLRINQIVVNFVDNLKAGNSLLETSNSLLESRVSLSDSKLQSTSASYFEELHSCFEKVIDEVGLSRSNEGLLLDVLRNKYPNDLEIINYFTKIQDKGQRLRVLNDLIDLGAYFPIDLEKLNDLLSKKTKELLELEKTLKKTPYTSKKADIQAKINFYTEAIQKLKNLQDNLKGCLTLRYRKYSEIYNYFERLALNGDTSAMEAVRAAENEKPVEFDNLNTEIMHLKKNNNNPERLQRLELIKGALDAWKDYEKNKLQKRYSEKFFKTSHSKERDRNVIERFTQRHKWGDRSLDALRRVCEREYVEFADVGKKIKRISAKIASQRQEFASYKNQSDPQAQALAGKIRADEDFRDALVTVQSGLQTDMV
jgi:hypothetical protein